MQEGPILRFSPDHRDALREPRLALLWTFIRLASKHAITHMYRERWEMGGISTRKVEALQSNSSPRPASARATCDLQAHFLLSWEATLIQPELPSEHLPYW